LYSFEVEEDVVAEHTETGVAGDGLVYCAEYAE
jgi:hypothetical protein